MDIEATLGEMADREAITLLSRKCAMGIDMRDWELYRSIFTDEIETDFTSWSGGEPRTLTADQWVAGIRTGISGFRATQHMIVPYTIEFSGPAEATSIAYMYAQHYLPNDQGDNFLWLGGHYTNEAVRVADRWKFKRVQLTVTWTTGNRNVFQLAGDGRRRCERGAGPSTGKGTRRPAPPRAGD